MKFRSFKKFLLLTLAVSTFSVGYQGQVQAAFGSGTENRMAVLHAAANYNPHLKDAVVASDASIVQVTGGRIRGSVQNGIYQYLGVPYAEARERFVKAGPVTPWKGVKDATQYGAISPQYLFGTEKPISDVPVSNNCQNLNIWTSTLDAGAKKPVMVWLHGGGFVSGSGNEAWYDGENLSRKGDVVVVTVNHRLNVLGHLDLSAYGDKYKDSPNVGSMDMVEALRWIRANIAKFGGDPNNVTLFGQSGGGSKVELMSAPSAKDAVPERHCRETARQYHRNPVHPGSPQPGSDGGNPEKSPVGAGPDRRAPDHACGKNLEGIGPGASRPWPPGTRSPGPWAMDTVCCSSRFPVRISCFWIRSSLRASLLPGRISLC